MQLIIRGAILRRKNVCFNPRTREGCDCPFGWMSAQDRRCFNPRTRVGCDQMQGAQLLLRQFQSTHPRGVRHFDFSPNYSANVPVSIHAPARGATRSPKNKVLSFGVSIHAPARGATLPISYSDDLVLFQSTHPRGVRLSSRSCFNPRTREGCDCSTWLSFVSIHAPARVRDERVVLLSQCFNPRTREGCDLFFGEPGLVYVGFNPRTREGCDRSAWT